ncbi:MAG: DUF2254 domain-containing protein [Ornithinimicrobium sp.]
MTTKEQQLSGGPAPTPQPRRRTDNARRRLTKVFSPFWVVPALCCLMAFALGLVLPELDQQLAKYVPFLFPAGPDGARTMLSTIAGAMISLTGLVFSITIVVLQLASSQFSPRVLNSFLDERVPQVTLGVFAASFVYALTVMRTVTDTGSGLRTDVPQIAVTVSFLLVLASVAMFLAFIHHITQAISVEEIVQDVGGVTRDLLRASRVERSGNAPRVGVSQLENENEHHHEAHDESGRARSVVVVAEDNGYLNYVDAPTLVEAAAELDARVEVLRPLGTFVVVNQPVAVVHPLDAGPADPQRCQTRVLATLSLTSRRSMEQDVTFGIRQLVDIAERALSPGINDPTTAVQVLNELHTILRCIAVEPDTPAAHHDSEGVTRAVLSEWSFGQYLDLSIDEIAHWGESSLQVAPRLQQLLEQLAQVAQPEHKPAIERKLAQVTE